MKGKSGKLNKGFNPEKYQMSCCPHCRGRGKSPHQGEGVKVCWQCGGFGWIRKGDESIKGGEK